MANTIVVDILADTRSLVAGVKQTNSQLGALGKNVSGIKSAFSGLAATFGLTFGVSFLADAVKGASEEQANFKKIADLFGADAEGITKKINELSKTFKVDDGALAAYFVQLKSAFSSNFDKFVPTVVEASATLALLTGKPLDEVINLWAKTLRDGKITAQEVQKLGIDLTSEQEKKFNSLKTTAERLQFLLDIINSPENKKKALDNLSPYEKLNFYIGEIKDKIGEKLIPILDKLFAWFEKLTPSQQNLVTNILAFVAGILALSAAFAPFLLIGFELLKLWKLYEMSTKAAALAQALFNGTLLANPITWVVIAVIALIAAIVLMVKHWDEVVAAVKRIWGQIKDFFGGLGEWFKQAAANLGAAFVAAKDKVVGFFINIKNDIINALSSLKDKLLSIGRDIIQGLINGIQQKVADAINVVKNLGNAIKDKVKGIFGIGSPSKVFAGYGKNLMQGLAIGINKNAILASNALGGLNLSPEFATGNAGSSRVTNITINAGLGTDSYELGRVVKAALVKYEGVNGR